MSLVALSLLASASSILLPLGSMGGSRQNASEELAELIAQLAPPEQQEQRRNVRMKGSVQYVGYDGVGEWIEVHGRPGEARIDARFDLFGSHEQGANGGVVWEAHPAIGIWIKDPGDAHSAILRYAWSSLRAWEGQCGEVRSYGVQTVEGRDVRVFAYGPREAAKRAGAQESGVTEAAGASAADSRDLPHEDLVLVDASSGKPWRLLFQERTRDGSQVERIVTLSDWRTVDGIEYPFKKLVSFHDTKVEIRFESIEHDVELGDDAFALPERVANAAKDAAAAPGREGIRVQDVDEQHVAVIRFKCKPADIGKQLGVALPELMMYLNAIGAKSHGAPYTRYYSFTPDSVDMEAGMPVAEPVVGKGRVKANKLPACRAAVAWHVGPYHTLSETHQKLDVWVAEQGLQADGPQWEVYWTDPGMEPDPTKWRTQVFRPVKETD
jgi:effector-binding domain-containing protein